MKPYVEFRIDKFIILPVAAALCLLSGVLGEDRLTCADMAGQEKCERDHPCFTLWGNDTEGVRVVQRGCWNKEQDCSAGPGCVSKRINGPWAIGRFVYHIFCCCDSDMCNQQIVMTDEIRIQLAALREPGNTAITQSTLDLVSGKETAPGNELGLPTTVVSISTTVPFPAPRTDRVAPETFSSLNIALVIGGSVLAVLLIVIGFFAFHQRFRHFLLGGKPMPVDPESALQMAPLMSKEYENQDGCQLMRSIQLIERKASGRYGEVWRGKLAEMVVAIKITPNTEVATWRNETNMYHKFLMPLQHPNILRFIMAGKMPSEQRWALVTEYHPAGSLSELLKGRSINLDEAEKIMVSMLTGIAFLHDCRGKPSIAHRDFKSTNVLVKADMTTCIADFGLATNFEPDEIIGDKHGQVGTRRYMAPELLEGAISLNVGSFLRVDIYACGLVLWEILSRCQITPAAVVAVYKLPLEEELGIAPTSEAIQMAVVHKRLRPTLKDTWKNDPRVHAVCQTIEECWDADPEARPSGSCLLNRMRDFANGWTGEDSLSAQPDA